MVNQLIFEQDMQKPVQLRQLHGSLYENDNNGLQIAVRVFNAGQAVTLAGTIACEIMLSNGNLEIVNGSRNENLAYANIPSSCLKPGVTKIILKNIEGSVKTTILAISGTVSMVRGSAYIDPGSVIPDLSEYTELVDRAETAANNIARLSTDAQLIAGDRYRCIVAKI